MIVRRATHLSRGRLGALYDNGYARQSLARRGRLGAAQRLCTTDAMVREMNQEMADLFGTPPTMGGPSAAPAPAAAPVQAAAPQPAAQAAAAAARITQHPDAEAALHSKIAWASRLLDESDDVERCTALARCIFECARAESALRGHPPS